MVWNWSYDKTLGLCHLAGQYLVPFIGRSDAIQVCIVSSSFDFYLFKAFNSIKDFVPKGNASGHNRFMGIIRDCLGHVYLTKPVSSLKRAKSLTENLYNIVSEVFYLKEVDE